MEARVSRHDQQKCTSAHSCIIASLIPVHTMPSTGKGVNEISWLSFTKLCRDIFKGEHARAGEDDTSILP